jgi:hypothetical protein
MQTCPPLNKTPTPLGGSFLVVIEPSSFFKEVARGVGGGERTWVLSISFIFSFLTTLLLSHNAN